MVKVLGYIYKLKQTNSNNLFLNLKTSIYFLITPRPLYKTLQYGWIGSQSDPNLHFIPTERTKPQPRRDLSFSVA